LHISASLPVRELRNIGHICPNIADVEFHELGETIDFHEGGGLTSKESLREMTITLMERVTVSLCELPSALIFLEESGLEACAAGRGSADGGAHQTGAARSDDQGFAQRRIDNLCRASAR